MAVARLNPLPLLVVDLIILTQVMAAGAAGNIVDDFFMPIVDLNGPRVAAGAVMPASDPGDALLFNAALHLVLAEDEKKLGETFAPDSSDSKTDRDNSKTTKSEKSDVVSPPAKTPASGKSAAKPRMPESRLPAKPAGPMGKPQEQEVATGKSPSILQMLEGHETELLVAMAIALAFFLMGWICGGNYYLRRDRRRRTKLRF
jgi:hypothetical protein